MCVPYFDSLWCEFGLCEHVVHEVVEQEADEAGVEEDVDIVTGSCLSH